MYEGVPGGEPHVSFFCLVFFIWSVVIYKIVASGLSRVFVHVVVLLSLIVLLMFASLPL